MDSKLWKFKAGDGSPKIHKEPLTTYKLIRDERKLVSSADSWSLMTPWSNNTSYVLYDQSSIKRLRILTHLPTIPLNLNPFTPIFPCFTTKLSCFFSSSSAKRLPSELLHFFFTLPLLWTTICAASASPSISCLKLGRPVSELRFRLYLLGWGWIGFLVLFERLRSTLLPIVFHWASSQKNGACTDINEIV